MRVIGTRLAIRASVATLAPAYAPRRPTETALYGIVRDNLETFLAWARETYAKPLPRYVEQELRAYLRCGVFAHGFVHCRCDDCGHDILVAFCDAPRDTRRGGRDAGATRGCAAIAMWSDRLPGAGRKSDARSASEHGVLTGSLQGSWWLLPP